MAWKKYKKTRHPKGLRYKLMVAFSVMSLIPIMACIYIICNYLFPNITSIVDVSLVMLISLVLSLLGLMLAKSLIDPVIDMAIEAKMIASGAFDKKIEVARDDEIGNIGESINEMTQRIKNNIDELKAYGQKTREINIEIHKNIIALSSLLQIGDIVSSSSMDLDSILELCVQKVSMVFDGGYAALYLAGPQEGDFVSKVSYNIENETICEAVISDTGDKFFDSVLRDHTVLVIDEGSKSSKAVADFKEEYSIKNMIAIPIYSGRRNIGVLAVGNRIPDFKFRVDDIDLVKVFSRQMTIAVENNMLLKRAEELAIVDELTGLFNKNYILSRLEDEIKRAIFYQRPCSFIIFNIDGYKAIRDSKGELVSEEILIKLSKLLKDNATPMGRLGRIGGDEFALLLPEKNKKEAYSIAEDIRKKVEATQVVKDSNLKVTVSSGVSENPIDGSTKEELFKKAQDGIRVAKSSGKNKVVV